MDMGAYEAWLRETKNFNDINFSPEEQRFWSKVVIVDDDTSCWIFRGSSKKGTKKLYTQFREIFPDGTGRTISSHRKAFMLANPGIVPNQVRHTCDNPPCCRPTHLLDGTHQENMNDRKVRGRNILCANPDQNGEKNNSAVLTEDMVLEARRRHRAGEPQSDIARSLGVERPTLTYAITGKTWKHLNSIEEPINRKVKITADDVRMIRGSDTSAYELAQHFGVTPSYIHQIRTGKLRGNII